MASINPYPSGSDILAPLPLYTPDFGVINSMLQRRSNMYEQGLGQLKSADNLIRSAQLSVTENGMIRDQYLRQAEDKLKQMTGVDLSQSQNVDAANNIYSPFWQDQDLLMDYSKTSAISSERAKAESLMQSSDPKAREGFWQTGVDYVNLAARDLSMAKRGDGSIAKVQVNKYVPYFDVMGDLQKRAKDQGLSIETETVDGTRQYKITRINGDASVPLFKEWAARELANMPQATDIFRVEGVVDYRSKVQNYQAQGLDEVSAKSMVANDYMKREKNYYESRYSEIDVQVTSAKAALDKLDLENSAKSTAGTLTNEDIVTYQNKFREYNSMVNARSEYAGMKKKYEDPASKEYQDIQGSILQGGEQFFAENRRNAFINNFARAQAINSKVKYDIDPGYKMQMEINKDFASLQKEYAELSAKVNGLTGSGSGSGSGAGTKKTGVNELNTPLPIGLNVKGNDPILAIDRMKAVKERSLTSFLDNTMSVINEANLSDPTGTMVSPAYRDYLTRTLRTGKFNSTSELQAEHKRLQDANIIPQTHKLGDSPTEVMNILFNRAVDIHVASSKVGMPNGSVLQRMVERNRSAKQYYQLREIDQEVERNLSNDPTLKPLYRGGKIMSKNEYLKDMFGFADADSYVNNYVTNMAKQTRPDLGMSGANAMAISAGQNKAVRASFEAASEKYDELYLNAKGRISKAVLRYTNEEGAYIGPSVFLRTDRKEDIEEAQNMAIQATSDENLRNQIVTDDGVLPLNITQLESIGADREDVQYILNLTKGSTMANVIDGVELSKIGSTGKPAVKIKYNMDELKKLLGTDKAKEYDKTIVALNSGVEIGVSDTLISGFNQEFTSLGMDLMSLDKNQQVSAPEVYKRFGFDYIISRDTASNQYFVKFQFPRIANGKTIQDSEILYVPINSSISTIQDAITSKMLQIHTGNQQVLQQQRVSSNFMSPQGAPAQDWNTVKQQITQ